MSRTMAIAVRSNMFRRLGMTVALALTSSCSILPATETLEIYRLPPSTIAPSSLTPPASGADILPLSLRITTPHSSPITDSTRVLALRQGAQVSVYKGMRWADPAPVLVRNRLAAAFRSDGRLASISSGTSNLTADLELGGDLSTFQVEYRDGVPAATIRFYATLVQPPRNRIAAARSFDISEPVQDRGTSGIIEAFGIATDRLAAEMIDWTMQQGMTALRSGAE